MDPATAPVPPPPPALMISRAHAKAILGSIPPRPGAGGGGGGGGGGARLPPHASAFATRPPGLATQMPVQARRRRARVGLSSWSPRWIVVDHVDSVVYIYKHAHALLPAAAVPLLSSHASFRMALDDKAPGSVVLVIEYLSTRYRLKADPAGLAAHDRWALPSLLAAAARASLRGHASSPAASAGTTHLDDVHRKSDIHRLFLAFERCAAAPIAHGLAWTSSLAGGQAPSPSSSVSMRSASSVRSASPTASIVRQQQQQQQQQKQQHSRGPIAGVFGDDDRGTMGQSPSSFSALDSAIGTSPAPSLDLAPSHSNDENDVDAAHRRQWRQQHQRASYPLHAASTAPSPFLTLAPSLSTALPPPRGPKPTLPPLHIPSRAVSVLRRPASAPLMSPPPGISPFGGGHADSMLPYDPWSPAAMASASASAVMVPAMGPLSAHLVAPSAVRSEFSPSTYTAGASSTSPFGFSGAPPTHPYPWNH